MTEVVEERVYYRDIKPYEVPATLDDLYGPATGQMTLPINVYWGPWPVVDLAIDSDVIKAYQAALREGRVVDQERLLNRDLLLRIWPELTLPARVRDLWEARFEQLAGVRPLTREDRISLALGRRTVELFLLDPVAARVRAEVNIVKMRKVAPQGMGSVWLDEITDLIRQDPEVFASVWVSESEHARDLRQMSPFAGLIKNDERIAIIKEAVDEALRA